MALVSSLFSISQIGVTPAAGLLKSILYKYKRKTPMKLKKVYFIWVSRDKNEFTWFNSLIDDLEDQLPSSFLEIQVYLTEKLTIDEIHNISIRDGLSEDPITELSLMTRYGRPKWSKIFSRMKNEIACTFKKSIGMFYCGPKSLADTLDKISKTQSDENVEFVFKKEEF